MTAFTAAGTTGDGSLTIDSVPRAVAAGTALSSQVRVGAFLRLRLTLDAFGRIADDAVLAAGASLAAVCGAGVRASVSPAPSSSATPRHLPPTTPRRRRRRRRGAAEPRALGLQPVHRRPVAPRRPGQAGEPGCSTDGAADAAAGGSAGDGGPIPDTASLARAGRVIGLMALPLLVLMLLVIGYLAVQSRREYALPSDRGADRGIEEVAP